MKKIVKDVVGALIEKDGKFLVARRKEDDTFGGLWEFPGGCVEHKEDKKDALEREIQEELGIEVEVGRLAIVAEDEIPELKIIFHLFDCAIKKGEPRPVDCQDVKWVTLEGLKGLKLAPIDIKIKDWLLERR